MEAQDRTTKVGIANNYLCILILIVSGFYLIF
ncbi:hypothetical protein RABR111495_21535 [Rahnella bruchi]